MVLDNFSAFDFHWMTASKGISFIRMPQSQRVQPANDNSAKAKSDESTAKTAS